MEPAAPILIRLLPRSGTLQLVLLSADKPVPKIDQRKYNSGKNPGGRTKLQIVFTAEKEFSHNEVLSYQRL